MSDAVHAQGLFSRQFAGFIFVSAIAAVANVGSRILFSHVLSYPIAICAAFVVGLTTAFVLNRLFVFRDPQRGLHHQVLWFVGVNLAALAQTLAISLLLARWILPVLGLHHHVETVAHAAGVMAPAITSYLGHRYLTFR